MGNILLHENVCYQKLSICPLADADPTKNLLYFIFFEYCEINNYVKNKSKHNLIDYLLRIYFSLGLSNG